MISPELMEYRYTCRDCGRDVVCGLEDAGASSHLCSTCRGELEMLAKVLRQKARLAEVLRHQEADARWREFSHWQTSQES